MPIPTSFGQMVNSVTPVAVVRYRSSFGLPAALQGAQCLELIWRHLAAILLQVGWAKLSQDVVDGPLLIAITAGRALRLGSVLTHTGSKHSG
jgi:hypothetical protein